MSKSLIEKQQQQQQQKKTIIQVHWFFHGQPTYEISEHLYQSLSKFSRWQMNAIFPRKQD